MSKVFSNSLMKLKIPEPGFSRSGRPIPGITGTVGDIEIDLKFQFTYYINTSSGRSPINIRAVGVLRDL